jgi:hypothetical protein
MTNTGKTTPSVSHIDVTWTDITSFATIVGRGSTRCRSRRHHTLVAKLTMWGHDDVIMTDTTNFAIIVGRGDIITDPTSFAPVSV